MEVKGVDNVAQDLAEAEDVHEDDARVGAYR